MNNYINDSDLNLTLENYFNSVIDNDLDKDYLKIVDEHFLTFVNESAEVKEFKSFVKRLSKAEDITDAEIKKFEKEITSDKFKEEVGSQYGLLLGTFLTAIAGYSAMLVGGVTENMPLAIAGSALVYVDVLTFCIAADTNAGSTLTQNKLDKYYDKIMSIQAKAKAKLLKIEHLSDAKKEEKTAKIKVLKTIISNADKLRTSYKSITNKLENRNKSTKDRDGIYKEEADFYYVTESGDVEMIQEMKGKAVKRELLKNTIDDLDEVLRARYKYLQETDAGLKDCINTIQKIKGKEAAAKAIVDLRKKAREFNFKNQSNERLKRKFIGDIRKEMMTFTNKYSFESAQAIKTAGQRLTTYADNIEKIAKKYDGETGSMNREIYKAIDNLYLSDSFGENSASMIKQFETIILSWQKAMNEMAEDTIKECDKIKRILGINKKGEVKAEKSITFKLLNFKERKAANNKEKESIKESFDEYFDVDLF